ncbi:MAG: hypothetical protein LKE30_01685 [Bacteroidales bacterium]|jgi:hypothetical protein|nr:hypothetical protein [Bacteroidales bacterium]
MKVLALFFCCCLSIISIAQNKKILDYDNCKDDISKSSIKKYEEAFDLFKDRKYQKASSLLQNIIKTEDNFASAYFLLGMIGVNKDNITMIEKYFPKVIEICPEFSHPLLFYYLGMLDYTNEHYEKAQKNFETFLNLSEGINYYDSLQNVAINYIDWSNFLHQTLENKVEFSPTKIQYLAPNMNYYEPFICYDNSEIYFIRNNITTDTNMDSFISKISTTSKNEMCVSKIDSDGIYDRGFACDAPFNSGKRESRVSITPDNNLLFYAIEQTDKDNSSWDIYYCEKFNGYWSESKPLSINTPMYDEFSPSISSDGNTLYFVSNRPGGKGGYDIWYCSREKDNSWGVPINMGNNINTFLNETSPFIALDNKSLYFLSNGWKTIGKSDIFFANIEKKDKPKNIGYPINTEENESSIGVMADGKTAYSTFKNKDNKFAEINLFTLPENVRSESMRLINGRIEKAEENINIKIKAKDVSDDSYIIYNINPSNNNFSLALKENDSYLITISAEGYPFYNKIINNNEKDSLLFNISPTESGMKIELDGVSLNNNNSDFTQESIKTLNEFLMFLNKNAYMRVAILGNKKTAEKVREYLIKSHVREDRVSVEISNSNKIFYKIQ